MPWTHDVFVSDDNDDASSATKMEEDNDNVDRNSTYEKNILVNQHGECAHKTDIMTFKCFCMVRMKEVSLVKIIIQLQCEQTNFP